MRIVAYAFGAAGFVALMCAVAGRIIGDPHMFMESTIKGWIMLSGSLTLLGIWAALMEKK